MSIFDHQPGVTLVNPVNCVGVMGKGLALKFKKRWPGICAPGSDYMTWCSIDGTQAGDVLTANAGIYGPQIVYFATKTDWRNQSNIASIERGLNEFASHHCRFSDAFAFPKLGCGHGGIAWPDVRELMIKYLEPLAVTCYVHGEAPKG